MLVVLPLLLVISSLQVFLLGWVAERTRALRNRYWFHPQKPYPCVSVVVTLHNAEVVVPMFLAWVKDLQYPQPWEVILVDDRSTDNTWYHMQIAVQDHTHIRVFRITPEAVPQDWHPGKKYALAYGVQQARYPWLVFTDADCLLQAQWLPHLLRPARSGAQVILGYSPYTTWADLQMWVNGSPALTSAMGHYGGQLLAPGLWQALIGQAWAAQYMGWAAQGRPLAGVGRNMAVSSAYWQQAQAAQYLQRTSATPGGTDEGWFSGRRTRVACVTHTHSQVLSLPAATWADFWGQQARHKQGGRRYPLRVLLLQWGGGLATLAAWTLMGLVWLGPSPLLAFRDFMFMLLLRYGMYAQQRAVLHAPHSALLMLLTELPRLALQLVAALRPRRRW